MEQLYQLILAASLYTITYALISKPIKEKLNLPDPLLGLTYGLLIGPHFLGIIKTDSKYNLFDMSRLVLTFQVMTIALQMPVRYVQTHKKSLFVLIFLVTFLSCLTAFVILFVLSEWNAAVCWAIATACTPTDPVLSGAILSGAFAEEHVPNRIRILLACESGLNDGIGIFLLQILEKDGWSVINKAIFPAFFGYLLGIIISHLLKFSYRHNLASRTSMTVFGIALSLTGMCVAVMFDQSELIFVFFVGTAFSKTEWFLLEARNSQFQTLIESLFNVSFFIFFGLKLDFSGFNFRNSIIALTILIFRRPIWVFLLSKHIKEIRCGSDILIIGWFGPIGVGALYYAYLADKILKSNTMSIVSVVVVFSVILHGLTVPFTLIFFNIRKKLTGQSFNEVIPRGSLTTVIR